MSELIADAFMRARKQHVCSWFPWAADEQGNVHSIEKGEVYRRSTLTDCGSIYTWKACAYHDAAAHEAMYVWGDMEMSDYDLLEQMREWWHEAAEYADAGLAYNMPFNAMRTY